MTISPFGWVNNSPPYINATNLELMLGDAGAYTDAETTRAEAAEATKAPLASPAFTGVPTAPTAATSTNTTQLATTAFVQNVAATISGTTTVSGALLKANNLSDVADAGSSRLNINISALAVCQVAATINVSLSGIQTIDGYQTLNGDLCLCTAQTTASQNGPWLVASGVWTRPHEYASATSIKARTASIVNGAVNGNSQWILKTPGTITVDSTATNWTLDYPSSLLNAYLTTLQNSTQKASAFFDDFEGATLDSNWAVNGTGITVGSNTLTIGCTTSYPNVYSVAPWDLTDSAFSVAVGVPAVGDGSKGTYLTINQAQTILTNYCRMWSDGTNLYAGLWQSGTIVPGASAYWGADVAYNSTNQKFWRIRDEKFPVPQKWLPASSSGTISSGTHPSLSISLNALSSSLPPNATFQISSDTNNPRILFTTASGVTTAGSTVAAVTASPSTITTQIISGTLMPILGTLYFDYSADGQTWTNLYNAPHTIDMSHVFPAIQSGYYGTNTASSATFSLWNVSPQTALVPGGSGFVPPAVHSTLSQYWDFTQGSVPSGWVVPNNNTNFQANVTMNSSQVTCVSGIGTFLTVAPYSGGTAYQGGTVWTSGGYSATVGCRVSFYCKFPSLPNGSPSVGLWGGPWLDGAAGASPQCEIDICEVNLADTYSGNFTCHEWTSGGSLIWSSPTGQARAPADMTQGFHWYEVIWDTNIITWLIDGIVTYQYTAAQAVAAGNTWGFNGASEILICGLGATTTGVFGPSINTTTIAALPLSMILQTVKVYT